jgi:hypothetical protein
MSPQRIQLRRVRGWRKPEGAVVVTRGTDWGNPYRVGDPLIHRDVQCDYSITITRTLAVDLFRAYVQDRGWVEQVRGELAGRDLACWCPLDGQPCHADVLLELANGDAS